MSDTYLTNSNKDPVRRRDLGRLPDRRAPCLERLCARRIPPAVVVLRPRPAGCSSDRLPSFSVFGGDVVCNGRNPAAERAHKVGMGERTTMLLVEALFQRRALKGSMSRWPPSMNHLESSVCDGWARGRKRVGAELLSYLDPCNLHSLSALLALTVSWDQLKQSNSRSLHCWPADGSSGTWGLVLDLASLGGPPWACCC